MIVRCIGFVCVKWGLNERGLDRKTQIIDRQIEKDR